MEKKTYSVVKNILLPIKSTIEIGPEGILNKKKFTKWEEIDTFSYSLKIVNGGRLYSITYNTKDNKRNQLHFTVSLTGSKKKKQLFEDIYNHFHIGFTDKVIYPKSEEIVKKIESGETVEIAKAKLSKNQITIRPGIMKKKSADINLTDLRISHVDGSGGFNVSSKTDDKSNALFLYEIPETRVLLATLERLVPSQAQIYFN